MRPPHLAGAQRTAAAAALMLVLLAIAATATGRGGSTGPPPGTHAVSTAGDHVVVVAVVVLVPILAVLGFAMLLYVQITRRRERDPEMLRRRRQARLMGAGLLAVLVGLMIYRLRHPHWSPFTFLHLRNPLATGHSRAPHFQRPHPGGGAISGTDWTLAALVWALLVLAGLAAYLRVRARRRELEPLALPQPLDDGDDLGLDAVRRERNPRRAVIAAYALMERLMARDGLERGPHEAPMEYLGRVTLRGHRGAASVHRLTALFQRARFGHRPVDEAMRRRAIAAVEELDAEAGGTP
jgi:hypothetical protein